MKAFYDLVVVFAIALAQTSVEGGLFGFLKPSFANFHLDDKYNTHVDHE